MIMGFSIHLFAIYSWVILYDVVLQQERSVYFPRFFVVMETF